MGDLRTTVISLVVVGLFMFAMLSFAFKTAEDNNATQNIMSDPILSSTYSDINKSLAAAAATAEQQMKAYQSDNPILGFGQIILTTIITVGNVFGGFAITMYNATFGGLANIIGVDPAVISVITFILLMSLIIYSWSVYRSGR